MNDFLLGDLRIEPDGNRIQHPRGTARLKPKEMEVLMELVKAEGSVVSRERLLSSVWDDVVVREDAPTQAISRIRKAMRDDRRQPRFIETIPKGGYRLLLKPVAANGTTPASSRKPLLRRVGYGALAVLLLVMTVLYITVRLEYAEAERALQEQVEPAVGEAGVPSDGS